MPKRLGNGFGFDWASTLEKSELPCWGCDVVVLPKSPPVLVDGDDVCVLPKRLLA